MPKRRITLLILAAALLIILPALSYATDAPPVGKPAPDFSLKSNEGKTVSLKDYRGKWIVLYFYPKDMTQGCTIEARNFQKDLASYEKANAVILGVSVDGEESHKEFCAKEGLTFKLLSDLGGNVSTTYGSVVERGGNKYSARNTFLIDPKGNVAKVFMGVQVGKHSEEVLAAIAELSK